MWQSTQNIPQQDRHWRPSLFGAHLNTLDADYCHAYYATQMTKKEANAKGLASVGDDTNHLP